MTRQFLSLKDRLSLLLAAWIELYPFKTLWLKRHSEFQSSEIGDLSQFAALCVTLP